MTSETATMTDPAPTPDLQARCAVLARENHRLATALDASERRVDLQADEIKRLRHLLATTGDGRVVPRGRSAPPDPSGHDQPHRRPAPPAPRQVARQTVPLTTGTIEQLPIPPGSIREALLAILDSTPQRICDLSINLGRPQQTISMELTKLARHGLVRREGKPRSPIGGWVLA